MVPQSFLILVFAAQNVAFRLDSGVSRALQQTRPGVAMQVRASAGPRLQGSFLGIQGDSVLLRTSWRLTGATVMVVDSIWTRHHPTVRKALKGMVMGALVGGAVQFARSIRASCRQRSIFSANWPLPDCRATAGNFAVAAAFWGTVGGVGGATIGLAFPEWKLRYAISSARPSRSH
jgi:hypothetical protein